MARGKMTEKEEISTAKDPKGFDFFGLPRELRNEIYGLLTRQKALDRGTTRDNMPYSMAAYLHGAPLPEAFTLCRQFKDEYEETFKHGFTMNFKDLGCEIDLPIVETNAHITKAEFQLLAVCRENDCNNSVCQAIYDLDSHLCEIRKAIRQFKRLRAIEVKVYKCQIDSTGNSDTSRHLTQFDEKLSELSRMPLTRRVALYPFFVPSDDGEELSCVEAYEAGLKPEKVWTERDGWKL